MGLVDRLMDLPVRAVKVLFGRAVIYQPPAGEPIELRAHLMSRPEILEAGIVGLTDAEQVLDFRRQDLVEHGLVPEVVATDRGAFEIPSLDLTYTARSLHHAKDRASVFIVIGDAR